MENFDGPYNDVHSELGLPTPDSYNLGFDACDKWANSFPEKTAIINVLNNGGSEIYTFLTIKKLSNQTANMLTSRGISKGDCIAILLPQSPEMAYSHIAIAKLGGISVPILSSFDKEALSYRINHSGSRAVITDIEGAKKLELIDDGLVDLEYVFVIDGDHDECLNFHAERSGESIDFTICDTSPDDSAQIVYASDTTEQPKGTLYTHRTLLGHIPEGGISYNGLSLDGNFFRALVGLGSDRRPL